MTPCLRAPRKQNALIRLIPGHQHFQAMWVNCIGLGCLFGNQTTYHKLG